MAPDSPEILRDRERALENEFFRRESQRLLEKRKQLQAAANTRDALAKASGIAAPEVLDKLIALGIKAETVAALSFVPLVEVAWADGTLDAKERAAILDRAREAGIAPGTVAYELLEAWLEHRPEPGLSAAWREFVQGLRSQLSPAETAAMKAALLDRARTVASASGGIFSKVSSAETAVIEKLERAFGPTGG